MNGQEHYFIEPHGGNAQAVHFGTGYGSAIFFVNNRPDHDPERKVTVNTMAAFDAYHVAKAFVEFWEDAANANRT